MLDRHAGIWTHGGLNSEVTSHLPKSLSDD
jgi:hypothetical protein